MCFGMLVIYALAATIRLEWDGGFGWFQGSTWLQFVCVLLVPRPTEMFNLHWEVLELNGRGCMNYKGGLTRGDAPHATFACCGRISLQRTSKSLLLPGRSYAVKHVGPVGEHKGGIAVNHLQGGQLREPFDWRHLCTHWEHTERAALQDIWSTTGAQHCDLSVDWQACRRLPGTHSSTDPWPLACW